MQWPSPIGVYFLTYVLVILPWLAWRSAHALRGPDRPQLTPARVWRSTAVMLSLLGALAWLAGSSFDYPFFAVPHLRAADVGAAGVALALNAVGFFVSRRCRPEDERRRLAVWALSPRTREDWAWALLAIATASVAEEIAYRGVSVAILTWMTGSAPLAIGVTALAFGGAHAVQGARSMGIITAMALVAHGLVWATDTLVIAMVVHAVYDLGAVLATSRALRADPTLAGS